MAAERGWWSLEVNVELFDEDREHIADLIRKGFTSGEVCVTLDPADAPHVGAVPRSWILLTGVMNAGKLLGLLADVNARGIALDDLDAVRAVWAERTRPR